MAGDSIYGLLWKLATVVVFWKAIFEWALKDAEGQSIIGKIKESGEGLGKLALKTGAEAIPVPLPDNPNGTLLDAYNTLDTAVPTMNRTIDDRSRNRRMGEGPARDNDRDVAHWNAGPTGNGTETGRNFERLARTIGKEGLRAHADKIANKIKASHPNLSDESVNKIKEAISRGNARNIQEVLGRELNFTPDQAHYADYNNQRSAAPNATQNNQNGTGNSGNTTNQNNTDNSVRVGDQKFDIVINKLNEITKDDTGTTLATKLKEAGITPEKIKKLEDESRADNIDHIKKLAQKIMAKSNKTDLDEAKIIAQLRAIGIFSSGLFLVCLILCKGLLSPIFKSKVTVYGFDLF